MVERAGERRHRFRLHAIQHRAQIREEYGFRQSVAFRVLRLQRGVGIENAGDLHVFAHARGA